MWSELRSKLHDDVAAHLRELGPGSDHARTVWAAGVITVSHALDLSLYLESGDPQAFAPSHQGGVVEGYRYTADPSGVTLTSATTGHSATVRWRDIADRIAPALRRPRVRDAIETALRERVELTRQNDQASRRWQLGQQPAETQADRDARNQAWRAVEHRCYQLAAEAWDASRPTEQTALFDL